MSSRKTEQQKRRGTPAKFIALLRGINVGGHNRIPMADLCSLCANLGWGSVRHYIQSGNLVFTANGTSAALELELEKAIEKRFGISVSAIVCAAVDWPSYVEGNPFPECSATEAKFVMLILSKSPPKSGAVDALRERASNGERIAQVGDTIWIYFSAGVARSKLSPVVLERWIGSPVTARNWRTVQKLQEMANAPTDR